MEKYKRDCAREREGHKSEQKVWLLCWPTPGVVWRHWQTRMGLLYRPRAECPG